MIPDNKENIKRETIKFDQEGNTGRRERLLTGLQRFLDSRLFLVLLLMLVATLSFELGLLVNVSKDKPPITITEAAVGQVDTSSVKSDSSTPPEASKGGSGAITGSIVASKSGTKYYYPWCGSAARISDKNKIYFASVTEARAKGYTPAANCKGLE